MDMGLLILKAVLSGVVGYLLGSANTSLIVSRVVGIDVRQHGSGNAGATNTMRILGKKAAIIVTAGDIAKGVLAALFGLLLIGDVPEIGQLGVMTAGFFAIVGHNWPLYFKFKGGKGVLTLATVVFMMDWRLGGILLAIFILIVALTRYVSLGSVISAALFPILAAIPVFGRSEIFVAFALILGLLTIFRHKANIGRLIAGTESKLGAKKKENG